MTTENQSNNKEVLELKNLTADIKKKTAESIQEKTLSKRNIAEANKFDAQSNIDKAEELRCLLNSHVVDESKTIIGSEQYMTLTINGKNRDKVISKLMEVISRF